ncbi:helix-turn-helix transcriptional regulator [Nocardioides sp. YIM 152315]|uniref:helix-turn-helix transcriptional regulator n=1 Tax=Nocardioides sp. YIM 152315 TaxID=3031760 RepID=UPI0023DAF941|nr:helix-turn-helix transcriptional regulator [Nocardioides sp. YIM 152315]MDF1604273.1 helix-turn-helix transcriptional regulator [Nocardioides sp. YIM 152315]
MTTDDPLALPDPGDDHSVVGVGLGPRNPMPESVRQTVLDAAAALQMRRTETAAALRRGGAADAEVVATGVTRVNRYLYEVAPGWQELLSVRPSATVEQLRVSVPANRRLVERGLRMVSLFDYDALDLDARLVLAHEPDGNYLFGSAPVQMKIIDRRSVLLQGPEVDGEPSLMSVTSASCLDAAWHYWDATVASAIPLETGPGRYRELTARQQQIVGLLLADLTDDAVAASIGVSVRTIRSDVAAILTALGVKSRFAAGARLQLWAGRNG